MRRSIWNINNELFLSILLLTQKMATGVGHLNKFWGPGEGNLTAENQESQMPGGQPGGRGGDVDFSNSLSAHKSAKVL